MSVEAVNLAQNGLNGMNFDCDAHGEVYENRVKCYAVELVRENYKQKGLLLKELRAAYVQEKDYSILLSIHLLQCSGAWKAAELGYTEAERLQLEDELQHTYARLGE
jgi:hypothetical protein